MPDLTLERDAIALFEQALDLPEAEREAWAAKHCAGRPDLLARVEAMIAADREATLRTGAAADHVEEAPPPERIGAYRLVERIGRGGMGSVYLGERVTGDFAHRVAIKIIKPGLLSDKLVERFRHERQLLASLRHPHIAQLYDGGETESGSPYFIMEHVDGSPLLDWVEATSAPLDVRQRLFADICNAVAFAHRSLVVHRDLTPSNVLVTRGGVAKLIDFGIARIAADQAEAPREATSIASLSLTPGYAAPERLTGAAVTTAADIFSLGRVLERLIPPEAGGRELKAIVARATAADPLARYPTADALGADVGAWAAGLPVAAMNGGRRYAAVKFARRHLASLSTAAAALLLLVGAFALTLVANARAEAARAEAEQRFRQTRAIANALLFDAFDQVSRVPGSTAAREYLARTGLVYLEALAADEQAPVDVRLDAGRGFLRLAEVVGGGQAGQLGRYQDANALLARSEAVLGDLHSRFPADPRVAKAMAALLVEQSGTNLYNNNATGVARAQARKARALLAGAPAGDLESARLTADAIRAEADTFLWTEDYAAARRLHLADESFVASLPPAFQRDPHMMSIRAANLRLLGEAHHKLHDEEAARAVLDRAVAINREVLRGQPDDPQLRRRLVTSLRYRAIVHRSNERDELARQSIAEARTEAMRLRDRDPRDVGAIQLFTVVSEVNAQILADLGLYPESYRIGEEALAAHREMVARAGEAPGALRSMAQALRTDGTNHYNGGDFVGACRLWRQSHAVFAGLLRRGVLTDSDRDKGMAEMRDWVARACDPPRRALGRML